MLSTAGIVILAIFATVVAALGTANEAWARSRTQIVSSPRKVERSIYTA